MDDIKQLLENIFIVSDKKRKKFLSVFEEEQAFCLKNNWELYNIPNPNFTKSYYETLLKKLS